MKKQLFIISMLILSFSSWGQEPGMTKNEFQRKAKSQQTLAWVMMSSGFTASTIGVIIGTQNVRDSFVDLFSFDANDEEHPTGAAWMIAGGALMISSIPVFIVASRNKQKAASAFFKMESQPLVRQGSFIKTSFPAIALKISL